MMLATLADPTAGSILLRLDQSPPQIFARTRDNANSISWHPKLGHWYAVQSFANTVIEIEPDGSSRDVATIAALESGQHSVPAALLVDPSSPTLLVALFSGQLGGDTARLRRRFRTQLGQDRPHRPIERQRRERHRASQRPDRPRARRRQPLRARVLSRLPRSGAQRPRSNGRRPPRRVRALQRPLATRGSRHRDGVRDRERSRSAHPSPRRTRRTDPRDRRHGNAGTRDSGTPRSGSPRGPAGRIDSTGIARTPAPTTSRPAPRTPHALIAYRVA